MDQHGHLINKYKQSNWLFPKAQAKIQQIAPIIILQLCDDQIKRMMNIQHQPHDQIALGWPPQK